MVYKKEVIVPLFLFLLFRPCRSCHHSRQTKDGSLRRRLSANGRAFWQLWRWRSPLTLAVAVLDRILRLFSSVARRDGGCVPRVSSRHHRGALAVFQHLQHLYNVPRQEFVFYLQLRHFILPTLQDYLLPLATDLESLFLRLKSVKGFVLKCCCLFRCNSSHAL